jgi:amino acid adenylation domain-containing protein
MVGHYRTLLAGIAADCERTVSALPMLTEAERRRLLVEWNDTTRPYPARALPALFDEQAARTPDAVAARCGEETVTYRALGRRANRLARALVAQGVGRDVIVPVLADRGLAFLTAVLAVFKAGGAYLPLDPRHPPRRHAQVLAQTQSRLALVAAAYRDAAAGALEALPAPARPTLLDLDALLVGDPGGADADPLEPRSGPDDLAYVIFTSGSTGTPKGAMIEQRGLVNHLWAKIADLGLGAADVVAQTASQSFDISIWQMLAALTVGGCTLIVGDEVAGDPAALLDEVERLGATVLELVPSLLLPLVEHAAAAGAARPRLRRLRWLLPTGEALPPELCRRWFALYPNIPMVNAYGPAECADDVTHGFITAPPGPDVVRMPIGRPIANTRLYIVDRHLHPVPIGVVGELCVAGEGVGRGYLHDPARTAEAFLPDPFNPRPGARLYRTGDLARYRADGVIEFVGRGDQQVKVRGFRIELGEIETVLHRHPAVRDCAVVARDDGPSRRRLVAYVAPLDGRASAATADALRDFLRAWLPEYMVPSAFVLLPALPLTPNGKVDRRALPAPQAPAAPDDEFVPPRTELERTLARIWGEVLGIERVGVSDNFFALGGDSIQSIRVLVRAGQAGLRLTPTQFFQHQTVAELAAAAEAARRGRDPSHAPTARTGWIAPAEAAARVGVPPEEVEDAYPLAPMQSEMLAQALRAPRTGVYVEQLFATLLGELDLDALRRAWEYAFARHPALRTGFLWDRDGRPIQVVWRDASPAWRLEDVADLDAEAQRRRLDDYLARDLEEGFDLSTAPLARVAVFRTGARVHRLVWTLHHLLLDAWSGGLVLGEVLAAYDALRAGGSPPSAPVHPFREFVAWVAQQDQREAAAFWREALGAADLPTPLAAPWRPSPLVGHAQWRQALTPAQTRTLGEVARAARLTPAVLAQAAWALVLAAQSGRHEVVFGVTTAGRPAGLPGAETMVGLLINTLPLRVAVDPRAPLLAWLRGLHASHEAVRRYAFSAAEEIRAWIGAAEDAPLFHSVLRFQNFPVDAALRARTGSLRLADVRVVDRWGFPVSVVAEPGETLGLTLAYDPRRVDAAAARRLLEALGAALGALATAGTAHVAMALRAAEERL